MQFEPAWTPSYLRPVVVGAPALAERHIHREHILGRGGGVIGAPEAGLLGDIKIKYWDGCPGHNFVNGGRRGPEALGHAIGRGGGGNENVDARLVVEPNFVTFSGY